MPRLPSQLPVRCLVRLALALPALAVWIVPAAHAQPPPPPAPPPPAPKPPPPPRPVYSLIAPYMAGPGQGVLVRGSGFARRRPVLVSFAGQPVAQALTNSIGNFATGAVVPGGVAPGFYAVVSQAAGREVRATVRIVAGRRRTIAVATASTGARLSGSSTVGRPGTGLRVVARGLSPGASAVLVFGGKEMAKGKVGPGGVFARSFGVPNQSPGRHQFWVKVGRLKLTSYFDILPPGRAGLAGGVRMVAAGDIACQPGGRVSPIRCQHAATGQLAASLHPRVVAALGDNQYQQGAIAAYAGSFDATWGILKSRMRPAAGNHEYLTPQAAGYYTYFGSAARPPNGWYSYNLGTWHVVVLNTNCKFVDCNQGGAQDAWLRADLAANPRRCTLAYFHHPRFSSAGHYESEGQVYDRAATLSFWNTLYAHGVDVVVNGHSHIAERFAPQDTWGHPAPGRGIAQFTVGSGGINHDRLIGVTKNSRFRSKAFAVLELALGAGRYRWRFLRAPDGRILDAGSSGCH
jgi:Calcineurin-like phosphoesterase